MFYYVTSDDIQMNLLIYADCSFDALDIAKKHHDIPQGTEVQVFLVSDGSVVDIGAPIDVPGMVVVHEEETS